MNAVEALSAIKLDRAAIIALVFADTFGCGLLVVFVCWPSLYAGLDAVKLSMTAVAVTLPFVTAGTCTYHIGSIGRDYDAASEGLSTSVVFAVSMHVLAVLSALAAGVLAPMGPNPVWMPAPTPQAAFWFASAFYVIHMLFIGKAVEHRRPWLRAVTPLLAVLAVGGSALVAYGKWKVWWS